VRTINTCRKHSKKRDAILEAMLASTEHPSAEDIYNALKPQFPDLSLGTVYRNLSIFRENGQIMSVGFVNGQERFDARTHTHGHFVCEKCGRVLDVISPDLPKEVLNAASNDIHGSVSGYAITFTGSCDKCSKSQASA